MKQISYKQFVTDPNNFSMPTKIKVKGVELKLLVTDELPFEDSIRGWVFYNPETNEQIYVIND
jgi:hypothetical protein